MTPARPLPGGLEDRSFTVAEGRAAGLSQWDLDGPRLRRPTRGVRTAAPAPGPRDVVARCRELLPVLPTSAVFSHTTGLDLLAVDRPRGLQHPDDIHIEVPHSTRRPRRDGVTSHSRTSPRRQPVLLRNGLPVLPPERLWTQLAAELHEAEVVVLGDALIRRRGAQTSIAALRRAVDRLAPGTRGLRRLRRALPRLRSGTDSCQETRLRLAIVASGLPCPEVNLPVLGQGGVFIALPDLSYPELRVAIEYDGDVHRTDARAWRRDIARRQALEDLGWRQITCTSDDLRDPTRALGWIRAALTSQEHRVSRS